MEKKVKSKKYLERAKEFKNCHRLYIYMPRGIEETSQFFGQ